MAQLSCFVAVKKHGLLPAGIELNLDGSLFYPSMSADGVTSRHCAMVLLVLKPVQFVTQLQANQRLQVSLSLGLLCHRRASP